MKKEKWTNVDVPKQRKNHLENWFWDRPKQQQQQKRVFVKWTTTIEGVVFIYTDNNNNNNPKNWRSCCQRGKENFLGGPSASFIFLVLTWDGREKTQPHNPNRHTHTQHSIKRKKETRFLWHKQKNVLFFLFKKKKILWLSIVVVFPSQNRRVS